MPAEESRVVEAIKWYKSFKVKIYLLIIGLGIATLLTIAFYILSHERKALLLEIKKRGLQISRTLAVQAVQPLLYEDYFGLYKLAASYIGNGGSSVERNIVKFIIIRDATGRPIIEIPEGTIEKYLKSIKVSKGLEVGKDWLIQHYDRSTLCVTLPLTVGEAMIGDLRVGITLEYVQGTLAELEKKAVLSVLGILLGGLVISIWLGNRFTRPLKILTRQTRRLGSGHWGEKVSISSEDEIGQLARAINWMSQKLAESIEEIKRSEKQMARMEKLSTLGQISTGLAHEINNPLAGISNCVQALKRGNIDKEKREQYLDLIDDATKRIQKTIRELLDYSRQEADRLGRVDLCEEIRKALRILSPQLSRKKIRTEGNYERVECSMIADGLKLDQVFINILLNAIDATPTGGRISIDLYKSDGSIDIRISDNGTGIPREIQPKIFDPFFTTKPQGEGTGLGLAVSLGIVKAHGGDIRVDSESGKGSTFTISLPCGGNSR